MFYEAETWAPSLSSLVQYWKIQEKSLFTINHLTRSFFNFDFCVLELIMQR